MEEPIHHNSSHFASISDANLTPAQAKVIKSLARGQTVTAAAEDAGVHRTTIHHWIRTEPAFKIAVETAQSEYAAEVPQGGMNWTDPDSRLWRALVACARRRHRPIPERVPLR